MTHTIEATTSAVSVPAVGRGGKLLVLYLALGGLAFAVLQSLVSPALPTIGRELTSPSPALRYEAARAAGEMGEDARSLLAKLAPLLNDHDSEVALAAIWALGQVGGDSAKRVLQQVHKSEDETRRQAAADALDELSLGESMI